MKIYKKVLTYILAGAVATTSLPAYAAEAVQTSETIYEDEVGKVSNEVVSSEPEDVDALGTVCDSDIAIEEEADVCSEGSASAGVDHYKDINTVSSGITDDSDISDGVFADLSNLEALGTVSEDIPYELMDPEFLDMFIDESSASDYDLFEGAGIEAVNDANIHMPDPDELLEGYLETQIYEETGDEEALKGYETVIEIDDISDDEEGRNSLTCDEIFSDVLLEYGYLSDAEPGKYGYLSDAEPGKYGYNSAENPSYDDSDYDDRDNVDPEYDDPDHDATVSENIHTLRGEAYSDSVAPLFSARRDNLDDLNPVYTKCYDVIKAGATQIASGEESLGRFNIKFKDMGIQTQYSAKDLGVDHIYVYSYSCDNPECGHINQGRSKPDVCEKCGFDSLSQLYDYKCKGCGESFKQSTKPDKCSKCGGTTFSQDTYLARSNAAKSAITKILRSQTAMVVPTGAVEKTVEREDGTVKVFATENSSIDYAAFIEEGTDMDALKTRYQQNRFKLLYALLADIPYELYWFNKVTGWTVTVSWAYGGSDSAIDAGDSYFSFWLPPVPEYKDNESSSKYACDTSLTSVASQVIPKARAIAEAAAQTCETDYEKLYYFKKVIQDDLAPNYNSAATSSWEGKYGNPWQLIWVFDEDPETNVVCEGYSKAFKLLCDLSDFDYEGFDCYLFSGYLNRSGNGHMWNSVTMDDGYNYLIDITNSRRTGGTENMRLFLKGCTSWDGTWYSYTGSKYSYKDGSTYVFSKEELTMSDRDYEGVMEITLDTPPAGGYTYTGLPVVPVVKDVISSKDRHSLIANDEPFELGYPDDGNIDAGVRYVYAYTREDENDPQKRNYKNMAGFVISPGNIGTLCEVGDHCAQAYVDENTVETRIDVVNKNTGEILKPDRDYSVVYNGTRNLGTYKIRIDGKGNYASSTEKVVNMVITSDTIQVELKGGGDDGSGEVKPVKYTYTGEEVTPEVIVTNLATGNPLVDKKDYTLSYSNNISASTLKSTAKVTITGKGIYTSKSECDFIIAPLDVNDESIYTEESVAVDWASKNHAPNPVVRFKGRTLAKGTDYTVSYFKSGSDESDSVTTITEPGRYVMRIRGKGNFDPDTYRDVELYMFDNGGASGLTGVSSLTVDPIPDQKYTEKAGIPQEILPAESGLVVVRDPARSGPLVPYSEDPEDEAHTEYDYKISYSHNKRVGTAYVIITGNEAKGYCGQVGVPFNITGTSITKARVDGLSKLTLNDSVYTGKEVTLEAAADTRVSVSVNGIQLKYYNEETGVGDYTMAYENNTNAGTATVYFIGKNGYVGTLKKTFKITQRNIAEAYSGSTIGLAVVSCSDNDVKKPATAEYMKGGARPGVIVTEKDKDGNIVKTLKENVDYTVSYSNNKKLDTYTPVGMVTVKGTGNYKGTLSDNFYITTGTLSKSVELYAPDIVVIAGKEKAGNYKSKVTVTGLDGKTLANGTDYSLYYYKAVPEDTAEAEALTFKYLTDAKDADPVRVKAVPLGKTDAVTAGDKIYITIKAVDKKNMPALKYKDVPEGVSDEVLCFGRTIYCFDVLDTSNDISKGIFKISAKDYSGTSVTLDKSDFTDARINKKAVAQLVMGDYDPATMSYGDGCDFVVIGYSNNIKKGTAKVTVRGVNGYSGTKTATFKIGSKRFIWGKPVV